MDIRTHALLRNVEVVSFRDPWCSQIDKYTEYSNERLAGIDTGVLNILCAVGLPNADNLSDSFAELDEWTLAVHAFTEQNAYKFRRNPEYFEHSFAKYQMMAMATEIHHNRGIHY